jgi:hypothetical protein
MDTSIRAGVTATASGMCAEGLGVARLEGAPESFEGVNLWGVAEGYWGGKSYGLLSRGGILYMWFGPDATWRSPTETRLGWSSDLGKSRQFSEVFFRYTDGVSLPNFLNFGKDYAGARDEHVYSYTYDFLVIPNGTPTRPYGGLGMYDAPEPWGPWTTIHHTRSFLGSTNLFFANIPTKWISADGRTIYLIFTGYGEDRVARDAYQHIRGVLHIRNQSH